MIENKLTKMILIFAVCVLSLSCYNKNLVALSRNVDEPFDIIKEEYDVFKFLLKDKRISFVVLYGSPDESFGVKREFFEENFHELQTDTLDSYIERNKLTSTIDEKPFDFDFPVVNKKNSEKKLEKEAQYYEFSRVGFSKDGTQAFVHFSDVCNALCGEGNYYLLKKENYEWKVIKKLTSWKS